MYCKLLDEAVRELKGEKILEPGRYYLSVYTYDNQSGAYTVNVKGKTWNVQENFTYK